MYQIHLNQKIYFLPESWKEVSAEQLYDYIEVLNAEKDIELARLEILRRWLKIPTRVFTDLALASQFATDFGVNRVFLLETADKLLPIIDQYLDYVGFEYNLIPTLTTPTTDRLKLYSYSHCLENVSASEYSHASHHYQLFIDEPENLDHLRSFVACLYRPMRTDGIKPGDTEWNGDYREPFNPDNVKVYAKAIQSIHPKKLLAIKFCFERIMKYLGDLPNFRDVFKTDDTAKEAMYVDWDKIIRSIAGDKRGSVEQVKKIPVLEVFSELQYLEEELQAAQKSAPVSQNNENLYDL